MKTYLKVTFNSEGAKPSIVRETLASLGFMPTQGAYDFFYDWPGKATVEDVLAFADRIHAEMAGMGVTFRLETI